jgi:hypothetical protein
MSKSGKNIFDLFSANPFGWHVRTTYNHARTAQSYTVNVITEKLSYIHVNNKQIVPI